MLGGYIDLLWAKLLLLVPFRRSSPFPGSNNKTKKIKKIDIKIKNSNATTLRSATVEYVLSVNAQWASIHALHVS
jgi:hypothetical protein